MRISVAMCTYNGEKYIKEQLQSIVNQTRKVDEIIICDDRSSDQTVKIISDFFEGKHIDHKIVSNKENMGFKRNFYQSLSYCTGDIIFFCDQDDVWLNNKVEKVCYKFEENKDALLVFTNGNVTDKDLNFKVSLFDSLSFKKEFMSNNKEIIRSILADNYVTGASSAIRKDLIEKAKPFGVFWAHDYWFGVVAALNNGLVCIDDTLIQYRQHENNTIGVNKKINIDLLKRLFAKREEQSKNRDNLYAELRLPLLEYLIKFIKEKNINKDYEKIVLDNYNFWKKREKFADNGIFKNIIIVLKDALFFQQCKYRNTSHSIIKDFIKGIALANKNKL